MGHSDDRLESKRRNLGLLSAVAAGAFASAVSGFSHAPREEHAARRIPESSRGTDYDANAADVRTDTA